MTIGHTTLAAKVHTRNEDCHSVVMANEKYCAWGTLACLAAGIGEYADGRLAAEVTVHALWDDYYKGQKLGGDNLPQTPI